MRTGLLSLLVVSLGVLALTASAGRPTPAIAAEVLANPSFNNGLDSWELNPAGGVTTPSGCSCAETGSSPVVFYQIGIARPNATYAGRVTLTPQSGSASGFLRVDLYDSNFTPLPIAPALVTGSGSGPFTMQVTASAHPAAAYFQIRFEVRPEGAAAVRVSGVSVNETVVAAPPTSTPTYTPTPNDPSPSSPTPTPTATSPAGSQPTPTRTATPRPTPTRSSRPPATPTQRPQPPGGPSATPTIPNTPPPSGPDIGGLLRNGGFESLSGGLPADWSKVGGTFTASNDGYAGNRAGSLYSQTNSTKWLFQAVRVDPGDWYRANAVARISSGAGEASIRISWYASADGSGSTISQVDGSAASSGTWTSLSTGAVQAPPGAHSARVRLMLRPSGGVTALFDQATFFTTSPPPPDTPTPGQTPTETPTTPGSKPTPTPRGATNSPSPGASKTPAPGSPSRPGFVSAPAPRAAGPAPTGPLALALSEVFSDSPESGNDGDYEWVEVMNHGTEPIDLAGWTIGDAIRVDSLPSLVVPPGGYAVIAGSLAALPEGVPVVRTDDGTIGAGLNNGGDAVQLIAPGGTLVDAMSFGENTTVFDPSPPAPGPGQTIATQGARGGWMLSAAPTPGAENVFPEQPDPAPGDPGATPDDDEDEGVVAGATPDPALSDLIDDAPGDSPVPGYLLAATLGAGAVGLALGGKRFTNGKWPRGG